MAIASYDNDPMAIGRIDYQRSASHSDLWQVFGGADFNPPAYDLNKNLLSAGNGDDGCPGVYHRGYVPVRCQCRELIPSHRESFGRRQDYLRTHDAIAVPRDIGIKAFNYTPHDPRINVTGGFTVNPLQGGPARVALFGVNDDLSIVRGNHQFAFGASGKVVG